MVATSNETAAKQAASTAKDFRMTSVAEARSLFIDIAGPVGGSAWVTRAIEHVAARTGLSRRRLRGIWAKEAKRIEAEEMDALRAAARKQQEAALQHDISIQAFADRLAAVEARLASVDPTFFSEEIARLGGVTGRLRDLSAGGR